MKTLIIIASLLATPALACPLYPIDDACERMENMNGQMSQMRADMDSIRLNQALDEIDAMRARSRY